MAKIDDKAAAFFTRVLERLHEGARVYGDRSWSRDPDALLDEVQQEVEDICGWSVVLWSRLQDARLALARQRVQDASREQTLGKAQHPHRQ